jgi:hypothetical protein
LGAQADLQARQTIATASSLSAVEYYTGSADDGLRELLKNNQKKQTDGKQKSLDLRLAATLKKATLQQDLFLGLNKISLSFLLNGKKTQVDLLAKRNGDRRSSLASNDSQFSGTLSCLDRVMNEGQVCETSVADINSEGARVQIIFRESAVRVTAQFASEACLTYECERFKTLLGSGDQQASDQGAFKSAVMKSTEVISGKSAFEIRLLTHDDQVMKLAGSLISTGFLNGFNNLMDRSLTAADKVDRVTEQVRKTDYNDDLNEVRLQRNDGRGNLEMKVQLDAHMDGMEESFELRFERVIQSLEKRQTGQDKTARKSL